MDHGPRDPGPQQRLQLDALAALLQNGKGQEMGVRGQLSRQVRQGVANELEDRDAAAVDVALVRVGLDLGDDGVALELRLVALEPRNNAPKTPRRQSGRPS